MIFLTVGTQLPFDRLVRIVDSWALENKNTHVFGQIGKSKYKPSTIEYSMYLDHHKYMELMHKCTLVISHAGMGTILLALELKKPIIIFPRRVQYGEHRNDHQMATANWLYNQKILSVAYDELQLRSYLSGEISVLSPNQISPWASKELIDNIKEYIN